MPQPITGVLETLQTGSVAQVEAGGSRATPLQGSGGSFAGPGGAGPLEMACSVTRLDWLPNSAPGTSVANACDKIIEEATTKGLTGFGCDGFPTI